ncbi:hypothetical protein M413DRAFT_445540 [Hebeloma cylindrosporum]|uniref:Yeast cell wall synthesis Kre9/Knh1-like N-terminal domain-containing protein n=1 Tax=Hebeloma cylindrosporum TaxID=76867 RepID=A0A0C2YKK7_HEBCY|nr:hypothetical protein M413DRAFT_445540 [Hebeloma cylindrosporum h7]
MFSKVLVTLAIASSAFATVFVTAPVASTTYSGGKPAVVTWQDSGSAPSLKDFGPSKISIYVGNAQQQTSLQTLNESVDVSTTNSINFTPDASIGPNGNEYFIRFESLSLKDAAQPQFPALAFSAKFTLDSMTGVFSAAILSQISGQSTAPLATQSTPAGITTPVAATTTAASSSKKPTSTGSSAASASASSAAVLSSRAGWVGAVIGALVGVTMF